jgi:hypothetical protein
LSAADGPLIVKFLLGSSRKKCIGVSNVILPDSIYAAKAYGRVAQETSGPRDFEASLLLKAATKLQAALDGWNHKSPPALSDALLYNRRLWIVFNRCGHA